MTWNHVKSTTARGYGAAWQRTRERILKRDGYLCQCSECKRCNRVRVADEVDHIVPKAKGGSDDDDNLRAINASCHKRKTMLENGGRPRPRIGLDGYPVE
jgi:5-methylcytosine-specific restriction protein A